MKQRMMRKILSWALVLSMLLTMLPTAAFAEEVPLVGAIAESEEVAFEQTTEELPIEEEILVEEALGSEETSSEEVNSEEASTETEDADLPSVETESATEPSEEVNSEEKTDDKKSEEKAELAEVEAELFATTVNVSSVSQLQSAHPYGSSMDKTWIYTHPTSAAGLSITFSADTETESNYDYVYIYDGAENQVGKYAGTTLAGKTITVPGNVVKIRLTSDGSVQKNGFTVTKISVTGETIIRNGTCGTGLTWTLGSAGTLTISGNGAMADYTLGTYSANTPWSYYGSNYSSPNIKSIVIEEGVTSIGDYAFYYCFYAERVEIPSTVTDIGVGAFERTAWLEEFAVADGNPCYTVVDGVLYNKNVTRLIRAVETESDTFVMPSTVTEIAPKAFEHTNTTNIVLSGALKEIGDGAFQSCDYLLAVTNAGGVERIGEQAFAYCSVLKTVSGVDNLKEIGDNAFIGCYELKELTLPEGLESIGAFAFSRCNDYQVMLPSTVTEIGMGAFRNVSSISIDEGNKNFCIKKGLLMNMEQTVLLMAYAPYEICVIPNTVVDIWQEAFCDTLGNEIGVYVSSGITELKGYTFRDYYLNKVHLSEGLKIIHDNAFTNIANLESIIIPASVESIGNSFVNVDSLKSIYFLGDAPEFPEKGAGNSLSEDVTLYYLESASGWTSPTWKGYRTQTWTGTETEDDIAWSLVNGVLTISGSGELKCEKNQAPWWHLRENITNVVVSEGVTDINGLLLEDLDKMRTLNLPATLVRAPDITEFPSLKKVNITAGNTNLASYTGAIFSADMKTLHGVPPALAGVFEIPDGVTTIGHYAFENCGKLTEITVPASLSLWGGYPNNSAIGFVDFGCDSLLRFTVADDNAVFSSVDGVLFSKDQKYLLWFPSGRTGNYQIPNGTASIRYMAFLHSSLSKLEIPASVTSFATGSTSSPAGYPRRAYWAFDGWNNMTEIKVDPQNTTFCSVDGVLYTKDMTRVLAIPNGITEVILPDTVTRAMPYNQPKDLKILHIGESCSNITVEQFPALEQVMVHEDNLNFVVIDGVLYSRDMKTLHWCPRNHSGAFEIMEGVTSIGSDAFKGCTGLTQVVFPDSLELISSEAFQNCSGLTQLQLGAVRVSEAAFGGCTNLEKVALDGTTLPTYASYEFAACEKLTEVTLSGECTVGGYAFAYSENLDSVIAVGEPPYISYGAFAKVGQDFVIYYKDSNYAWPNPFAGYKTQLLTGCAAGQHAEVVDAAVSATCTTSGLSAGTHCSVCGKVLLSQQVIPATGHSYTAATFTWSEDFTSATASVQCHCNYVDEADCSVEWDYSVEGEITVTASAEFDGKLFGESKVIAVSVKSIEVTNLPTKLEYFEEDALDVTGGKIEVYYNNNTSDEIDITVDMISGYDNTKPGAQTLSVTYEGFTATFEVTVKVKTPVSVEVTALPAKLEYLEGSPIDVTGGKIKVSYNNGTTEEIEFSADMISGYDNEKLGVQTLAVIYGDFTATFDITVKAKSLVSIEVTTLPTKVKYIRNEEELDLTGAVLTLSYDNGTTQEIELAADMVSTIDHSYAGDQMIAVFYEDQFTFFDVTVVDRTAIDVTAAPTRLTYLEGETLDLAGSELTVSYSDGSSEVIELEHSMLSYDKTAVGDVSVTVSYGGFTDTFEVEMLAKSATAIEVTAPTKTSYLEAKDALDVTGGKIIVSYDNGTSEEIALSADMVSGFDNAVVGAQILTVTYGGFTATFEVEVIARSLSSIAVTTLPEALTFVEGTALDVTGGKITAYYDNDTSEEIDLSTDLVSGFDSSILGEQILTVSYDGKTTTITIEIVAKSVSSIAVTTQPTRLSYVEGRTPLDVTGGKVTIYYNNDTSKEIDLTADMVSGFDNTIVGAQTLTVTYGGVETTYGITVNAKVVQSVKLTAPTTLTYLQGAALDLTGGYLTVAYVSDDNYTEQIPLDSSMISGYNPEKAGVQSVVVTYEGKKTAFAVRVTAKSATSIAVTTLPTKLEYIEAKETLDVTGGKVTTYYNNGTSDVVDLAADMVSGFDNTVVGTQTLTVTYGGFTTTFEVEIVAAPTGVASFNGTSYATLDEALAAAAGGGVVQLLEDASASTLMLMTGVTLDLNGNDLTTDGVMCFGGYVVDNSADKSGKIVCMQGMLMLDAANPDLAVWNGTDGYFFTEIEQVLTQVNSGSGSYKLTFLPRFTQIAKVAPLLADNGGADHGVKIMVKLLWNGGEKTLTYSEDMIKTVYGGNAFTVTLTGYESFIALGLKLQVVVEGNGVATASAPITVS